MEIQIGMYARKSFSAQARSGFSDNQRGWGLSK